MNIQGTTAEEIFESIRTLVQSGEIAAGSSLPSVRDLAVTLGVNRNTVAVAYRRLVTSGMAVAQGRAGTIIRDQYVQGEQEGLQTTTASLDLASGNPNPAWLPDLPDLLRIKRNAPRLYGESTLNARLSTWLTGCMGADCPADHDINLTHGAVDAIERLLMMDLRAGDKVAVENPCFLSSMNVLRTFGMPVLGVDMDSEGMLPDALASALARGAKAVILTPRAQNPTGCSLSARRAKALARVLADYPTVLVVIDDHFAFLSNSAYHSVIPRHAQRWALIRSFSKTLGPDVRVAAVASDATTSLKLRLRLAPGMGWVSHLLQDIVEAAFTNTDSLALIARARDDYVLRRRALEAALQAQGIEHVSPGDGLNLWIPLAVDARDAALALARQGWLVRHGDSFQVKDQVHGLRITISTLDPAACERLALHVKQSLG